MPRQNKLSYRATPLVEDRETVVIGLVNNMPDGALRTTENQYRELLSAASSGRMPISLKLFSLPELHRSEAARSYIGQQYEDFDRLWSHELDGLIVTGTEPRAPTLADEPYWSSLTKLIDWAGDHTSSAIWSCLAAHAAVLRIDGICRRPLEEKLVGVFDCHKAADHFLLADTPSHWRIPHSRHNELSERTLVWHGYNTLSRSREAGVDLFIKQGHSLFVFFQGHPEYDVGALAREYERDMRRFLSGRAINRPSVPRDYFDEATMQQLTMPQLERPRSSDAALSVNFPTVLSMPPGSRNAWRTIAVQLYANWLSFLALQKSRRLVAKSQLSIPASARPNPAVFGR